MIPKTLHLSIESLKFLNEKSPTAAGDTGYNRENQDFRNESVEILSLREQLRRAEEINQEIWNELTRIEDSYHAISFEKQTRSHQPPQSFHLINVIRKIGDLAYDYPAIRPEIVSLCASVNVAVGPCVKISSFNNIPRVKVFQENIKVHLASNSDEKYFSSEPVTSDQEVFIPVGALPGNCKSCKFLVTSDDDLFIAKTAEISMDQLFAVVAPTELTMFRQNNTEISDSSITLSVEDQQKQNFYSVRVTNFKLADDLNPDECVLNVIHGEEQIQCYLDRMNFEVLGNFKQNTNILFQISHRSIVIGEGRTRLHGKGEQEVEIFDDQGHLISLIYLLISQ
jgi:hypothetical protein